MLIVDDEDSILQFVDRVLRDAGYETRTAHDGGGAIEFAGKGPSFDLLLTDLAMPGVTGAELARRLRQQKPDLKVLYLTGLADRLFSDRRVLWAEETFIEKPVTATGLQEALSLALFGHTHGPR